jgi:methylenetetrahydrofolate dehydrogenase (NADP+)/methenyltetrahydrofolate cyclohydrolase
MLGKPVASKILEEVGQKVRSLQALYGRVPGLAVVGFQGYEESRAYTRTLQRHAQAVGIPFFWKELPQHVDETSVIHTIEGLNSDPGVAGIVIETPLPPHVNSVSILDAVDPRKDVDGAHTVNAGRLFLGRDGFTPATPVGGMELLRYYGVALEGKFAVVVGRSAVVGRPLAMLLLQANATVAICHSKTSDLRAVTRQADVLAVAVGKPALVTADMVKPGAAVLDFGVNFVDGRAIGDVAQDEVAEVAMALTPVPGGTGPVTGAVLVRNVARAAEIILSEAHRT